MRKFVVMSQVVDYLFESACNIYLSPDEITGASAVRSINSIQVLPPPEKPISHPYVIRVNINQVALIKRPPSLPAWTKPQLEANAIRLGRLKFQFESAVKGIEDMSVSTYAEDWNVGAIRFQVSWYKLK